MNFSAIRWYLFVAFLSFMALKISLWPAIFVYPFCAYQILKKSTLKTAPVWLFLFGVVYFFSLFLWATTTGIELNLYGGLVSGIIFGLSGLAFKLTEKYVYPRVKHLNKLDLLIWPAYFYLFQQTLFSRLFVDASYLLDVPPFLPYMSYYIGSGGMHFVLLVLSICVGWSWINHHKKLKIVSILVMLGLLSAQAYHLYGTPVTHHDKSVKIALIQGNRTEEIDWKRQNAVELYDFYKEKIIESATNGAKIIIIPENTILFWSFDLDVAKTKQELAQLSKQYGAYIVFSTLEDNQNHQIESRGYVFSPDKGMEDAYPAQKVYDYIKQRGKFTVGDEVITYATPYGNLRLLICFEALFRDQLDTESDLDYDHIIVMANNQFLPSHKGLKTLEWNVQDLAGTYRKNVLYASNNGPTSLTNKYGRTTDRLDYDTEAILWAELSLD